MRPDDGSGLRPLTSSARPASRPEEPVLGVRGKTRRRGKHGSGRERALVSACLLGVECRYDGKSRLREELVELARKDGAVPVCPEQLGGLPTPRDPSEIVGGGGADVLDGGASVVSSGGKDVPETVLRGAREVLRLARLCAAEKAYLKTDSPSCGPGLGVTAAFLERSGVELIPVE